MADFGGFEIETPQEVLARLQKQREAARARMSPVAAQNDAIIQPLLDSLFGNPELARARAIEKTFQAAQQQVETQVGEDNLDTQIRKLKLVGDQLADTDPATAARVSTRVIELEQARLQRKKLQAQEDRVQTEFAQEQQDRKVGALDSNIRFLIDTETGAPLGTFDFSQPEQIIQAEELRKQNPGSAYQSNEDFVDSRESDRLLRSRLNAKLQSGTTSSGNVSLLTKREFAKAAQGNLSFTVTMKQLVDLIKEAPAQFGAGGQAVSGIQKLGAHGKSFLAASFPDALELNTNDLNTAMEQAGVFDARRRSLIIDLGYTLATAREDGRLTDQDVKNAVATFGGEEPDPRAITATLDDLVRRRSEVWSKTLRARGLTGVPELKDSHQLINDEYRELQDSLDELIKGFDSQSKATAPRTQQPAVDGVRKVRSTQINGRTFTIQGGSQ